MTAFLQWLVGVVIDKLLAAWGALIAAKRRDEANVDKGRAEAKAEGLAEAAKEEAEAQDAINRVRETKAQGGELKHTEFRD